VVALVAAVAVGAAAVVALPAVLRVVLRSKRCKPSKTNSSAVPRCRARPLIFA